MTALLPCPGCQRHVRASDSRCPFCETTLTPREVHLRPLPRLSRAAIVAFTTTLAVGCGSSVTLQDDGGDTSTSAGTGSGSTGPTTTSGAGASGGADATGGAGGMGGFGIGPMYGAPGGFDANGGASATGGAGTGGEGTGGEGTGGEETGEGGNIALYGGAPF